MRSLPLTLLTVATLLTPAIALAAGPTASPAEARSFEITALVLGGVRTEASGKIGFDGTQLSASAGCNYIGGKVEVDGNRVTIVGPTFMTEMACPGSGDAEATLIKILALGAFTITDAAWTADGGQVVTVEVTTTAPGPNATPPDEPISTGVPTISDPATTTEPPTSSCPPTPSGPVNGNNTTTSVDSGPVVGGGSSGSIGGGSAASTFPIGQVEPDASPGAEPGSVIGSDPGVGKPVDPCLEYAPAKASDSAAPGAEAQPSTSLDHLGLPLALGLGLAFLIGILRLGRKLPTRP